MTPRLRLALSSTLIAASCKGRVLVHDAKRTGCSNQSIVLLRLQNQLVQSGNILSCGWTTQTLPQEVEPVAAVP